MTMVARCATCGEQPDLSRATEALRRAVRGDGGVAAQDVTERVVEQAPALVRAGLLGGWTHRHLSNNPTHTVVFQAGS